MEDDLSSGTCLSTHACLEQKGRYKCEFMPEGAVESGQKHSTWDYFLTLATERTWRNLSATYSTDRVVWQPCHLVAMTRQQVFGESWSEES
jgi:hypothetical protein